MINIHYSYFKRNKIGIHKPYGPYKLYKPYKLLGLLLVFLFSGCATWYQRTADFQAAVNTGNFEKANKLLDKDKKQATGKTASSIISTKDTWNSCSAIPPTAINTSRPPRT